MHRLTASLIFLFLLTQTGLHAQRSFGELLFIDAGIGGIIGGHSALSHVQAGLGYRINDRHGVGASYHDVVSGNVYNSRRLLGVGLDYRYASPSGLLLKAGIGKAYDGSGATDTADEFVYRSSQPFHDFSVAYQFRRGLTLGVYLTTSNTTFDVYRPESYVPDYTSTSDELVYVRTQKEAFSNYGFTLGVALPGRARKTSKRRGDK